jgi:hypothetical protein
MYVDLLHIGRIRMDIDLGYLGPVLVNLQS